jgi:hypothetical protein
MTATTGGSAGFGYAGRGIQKPQAQQMQQQAQAGIQSQQLAQASRGRGRRGGGRGRGSSSFNPATGRMEYASQPSNFSRSSQRPVMRTAFGKKMGTTQGAFRLPTSTIKE